MRRADVGPRSAAGLETSLVAFVLHRHPHYTATETAADGAAGLAPRIRIRMLDQEVLEALRGRAQARPLRRDDPERAIELGLELDQHQRAVLGLAAHRAARQDRELVGVLEQALERVDVVDLLRDVGLGAVLAQVALDVARHRELRVEAHHRQAVEVGGGDLAPHRQAMVRRADDAHALVAQRPHLDAASSGAGTRRSRSRRCPSAPRGRPLPGACSRCGSRRPVWRASKSLLERLEQIDPGRVDGGDHHLADQRRRRGARRSSRRRGARGRRSGRPARGPRARTPHRPAVSSGGRTERSISSTPELLLELLDALAHRRLRDAVELRRFGEAAQGRDVAEETEAVHVGESV